MSQRLIRHNFGAKVLFSAVLVALWLGKGKTLLEPLLMTLVLLVPEQVGLFWQPGFSVVSEKLLGWFENPAMACMNFF